MKTTLLLARHGNTFRAGEPVLRVGGRTDLPLVESKLGTALGEYLKQAGLIPDVIYAAPLKRTMQTAEQIIKAITTHRHCEGPQGGPVAIHFDVPFEKDGSPRPPSTSPLMRLRSGGLAMTGRSDIKIISDARLIEIDYGIDEGKPEKDVIARLGAEALEDWNKHAIVPKGWNVDTEKVVDMWHKIAREAEELHKGQKVLIVTSNGLLRFVPHITGDFDAFSQKHDLKIATGGLCVFEKLAASKTWACVLWNFRPRC